MELVLGSGTESRPVTPALESPIHEGSIFMIVNGKRSDSYKPTASYARSTAKVDTDTTNSVTFKEHGQSDWAWCRAAPIRHKQCIENFGSGPTTFDSESVMKNDFRHHDKPERAALHRPQAETQVEVGNFETNTSYKKDYSKKQIEPVHAIRPKEYHTPKSCFEGSTTALADFPPHPGHKRDPPFKPTNNQQQSKAEFDCSTTTGQEYREWPAKPMEKPAWAKHKAYVPTPDDNVYSSSYQSDFIRPAPHQRPALVKPVPQDKDFLQGPCNSYVPKVTHYVEQFVAFSGKTPAKSYKMNRVYEPPTERFMGESVYKSNYQGDKIPPGKAIAPLQRRSSDESPHSIEFHTTYKDTFKPERPASCPAKELLTASDEFGHIGFKNCHQYCTQKSPRRCKTPKDMDPIFAATPESQKTDRERSLSRPPSAGKTPRSPSKAERPTSGRSSRPTTPRVATRPTSARKDGKTATGASAQTSPRKAPTPRQESAKRPTSAGNRNNSNSNASPKKRVDGAGKTKSDSPKKVDIKAANKNNSNANSVKAVSKPAARTVEKTPAAKTDTEPAASGSKSAAPPPIRPPKKDAAAIAPKVTKPAGASSKPVVSSTSPTASVTKTTAPTAPVAAASVTSTAPVPVTSTPSTQPLVPHTKPVEKPAPKIASTPPMSTSAPSAPTTNAEPLLGGLVMPGPPATTVEPAIIKPMVAATAAAAPPAQAPIRPPTLVAAPAAPAMPSMGAEMDLSMLDTTSKATIVDEPLVEVNAGSPKMPIIAPPPAPAQPVVRMGNGPREANLLN